jgi:class 3 adenylate cyclase/predicted ATPase/ABC-type transport system involved in cytochrome c biogenesis ATPase subunit
MGCPRCGASWQAGTKFCGQCGTALPRACPACGHANPTEAKFCLECGVNLQLTARQTQSQAKSGASSQPSAAPPTASLAERRQLTVMFCDMVGSSALSTRLDPEEQRDVVSAFQSCCANEIKRLGGMVAQYLGDGVLAYFGYPAAHEDDAERGVRAGLAILEVVGKLKPAPDVTLQARIGIASGVVVVGDLVREGVTQENAAIGETTNLAARLQSLAETDTIVIAPDTYRLVGALFEYRDLGLHTLKGFAGPVHVHQVLGVGNVESRFEAQHPSGMSPLFGREEEFDLLMRRWEQAERGEGRVVLVTGEAGIGKSRLSRALQAGLSSKPHTALTYHCSPHHQDSALHCISSQLVRAAGILHDDGGNARLDKLETLLSPSSENLAEDMPLFAALLSIPGGQRYPLPSLTPQELKARTLAALLAHMKRLVARQPVLMIFEDLHWIDPTSLELLTRIVEEASSYRLMVLATARPEFSAPWPAHRHTSAVALTRLGRSEIESIVAGIAQAKALPPEVIEQIVRSTDGVPLFVEELTKTVLESGMLRDSGTRYELAGPLSPLGIPSTLHASLLARLDRMASVKDVAQIGAVIGREFPYRLIAAVSALPDRELQTALGQLVAAELIFQRGTPPDATYQFKHALVQDAARVSLVRSRRQQLHGQIARVLEERFPDIVATVPELLAQHFTEASLIAQALPFWRRAGQRAIERSADQEAIGHLTKGLELVNSLPDASQRSSQELELQLLVGPVFLNVKGVASQEVGRTYVRAWELSQQIGEAPQKFSALWGLWYFHNGRGEHRRARELGEQFLALARESQDIAFLIMAHRALCNSLHHLGELVATRAHMEHVIALYDPHQHRSLALRYGQDPAVTARAWGALAVWLLGYPDTALKRIEEARQLASEIGHPPSVAYALGWAAVLHRFRREYASALEQAEAVIALSVERNFAIYSAWGTTVKGWALSNTGRTAEGCELVRNGLSGLRATGLRGALPQQLALLAETLALGGQASEGLRTLEEALSMVEDGGERNFEAELYRLKGELLLQQSAGSTAQAETDFRKAISVAREQQAKSLELRAAMSLARLWRYNGKRTEARDLLAPVYNWFTEGFDTGDLKDAKALLDELL